MGPGPPREEGRRVVHLAGARVDAHAARRAARVGYGARLRLGRRVAGERQPLLRDPRLEAARDGLDRTVALAEQPGGGAFDQQMHFLDEVQPPVFVPAALNRSRCWTDIVKVVPPLLLDRR